MLAAEGLVELTSHRGTRVTQLTVKEVDNLFQVMGAIEALSGELACQFVNDDDVEQIEAMHREMVEHAKGSDPPCYFRLNQQIHEMIVDIADNQLPNRTYQGLAGRIRRYRYMANLSMPRWKQAVREHEEIIDALSERDGPCPAVILRRHLKNKCEVVKLAVAEENKPEKSANRRPGGPPPCRGRPASRVTERRVEAPQPVKPR